MKAFATDDNRIVPLPGLDLPRLAAVSAVLVLAIGVNVPALWNGFVWDDIPQVLGNRWLTSWSSLPTIFRSGVWDFEGAGLTNYYRPLMHVVYLALYQIFGPAPSAFHLVNVMVNAAVSVIVMLLAERILVPRPGTRVPAAALAAGLLFAANPIHSEPVAWVSALPDLAGTAFGLWALLLLVSSIRDAAPPRPGALLRMGLVYFTGLLFKEPILVVLGAMVGADLLFARGQPLRWRALRLLPPSAAAVTYLVIRISVLGEFAPKFESHGLGRSHAQVEAPVLLARYVWALLWPFDLSAYREIPAAGSWLSPMGLVGLAIFAALCVMLAVAVRRSAPVALGLILLGVGLVPPLATSAISGGRFGERYLYLASAGAAVALAGLLAGLPDRRSVRRVAAATVLGLLVSGSATTVVRLPVWRDEVTLWGDAARKEPGAAVPRYNHGSALLRSGRLAEAESELRAALPLTTDGPLRSGALNDLGRIEEARGNGATALELYQQAVAADPRSASARANLGAALADGGRLEEALVQLRTAADLRPDEAGIRFNLGLVLADLGRNREAAEELEVAARIAPGDERIASALRRARSPEGR